MNEELGSLELEYTGIEYTEMEDFLKPACYMDDFYDTAEKDPTADCENLYALPC